VTLRPNTPHSGTEENPISSWEFDVTADMYAPAWSEGAAIQFELTRLTSSIGTSAETGITTETPDRFIDNAATNSI